MDEETEETEENDLMKLCNLGEQLDRKIAGSFINGYKMYYLRKECIKYIKEKLGENYVFMLRIDCRWDFKNNITIWINNHYNVHNLRIWRKGEEKHNLYNKPHLPISDHSSIGKCGLLYKIYNMSDREISRLFYKSINIEQSLFNRLKDININIKIHNVNQNDFYLYSIDS